MATLRRPTISPPPRVQRSKPYHRAKASSPSTCPLHGNQPCTSPLFPVSPLGLQGSGPAVVSQADIPARAALRLARTRSQTFSWK